MLVRRANLPKPLNPYLFEPKTSLHDRALDIADTVLQPDAEHCILLPLRNSSGFPVRLQRGETIGRLLPIKELVKPGIVNKERHT